CVTFLGVTRGTTVPEGVENGRSAGLGLLEVWQAHQGLPHPGIRLLRSDHHSPLLLQALSHQVQTPPSLARVGRGRRATARSQVVARRPAARGWRAASAQTGRAGSPADASRLRAVDVPSTATDTTPARAPWHDGVGKKYYCGAKGSTAIMA